MRHTLLVSVAAALVTFTSMAFADEGSAIDPSQLCDGGGCSEPMMSIAKSYAEGFADFTQKDVSGFSGKCFHLDNMYDPNYAHYGAFTFAHEQNQLVINGMFGFFYNEDPYAGMSASELRSALEKGGSTGSPGIVRPDHVELAYVTPTSEIRYWYRSDKAKGTLFVIGLQASQGATTSLVFCKLLAH